MLRYILGRTLQVVLTFGLFVVLTYVLLEAQPGDYSQTFIDNPRLTPAQREALERNFGLDEPAHVRFFKYIGNLARGDLGISYQYYPKPVTEVIAERAPRTLVLFITSTVVSFYVGFLAGKILAWQRGRALEYVITLGGATLFTIFLPWFALLMLWLFAYTLDWFPIGKFISPQLWRTAPVEANVVFNNLLLTALAGSLALLTLAAATRRRTPRIRTLARWGGAALLLGAFVAAWAWSGLGRYAADMLWHIILPVLTLTLVNFAGTMLLTRNSMLETLREDYITTARAKGLPEHVIRDKHAARNALLPVVTTLVFALATALGGGIITENIFSWPGMGEALLISAQTSDIPTAMGCVLCVGILALVAHLVVDVLYAFLDPRIRYA
jgi:peptide/nickel transport system permease protein